MKYIVCEAPYKFVLKEKAFPQISPHEVRIQIKTIGICGTDLHAYAGNQAFFTYPRILGHELGATVIELGAEVSNVEIGDKVVVMPYLSCGTCIACRSEKSNCCTNIQVLGVHTDGGMQEQLAVPSNILMPANDLSYEQIALIEPFAIGAHAIRRAQVQAGETIVVVGCGPIGLGIMKLAQLQGAEVIAVDLLPERLAFAKEKLGIEHALHALENPIEQVLEITNGNLATAVFDATGSKQAIEGGLNYMAHGGRYVLVGLYKNELTFLHPAIHAKETSLLCSRNATLEDFQIVIESLRSGQIPTHEFITHRAKFEEMISQFKEWTNPANGVIKAILAFT